MKKTIVSLIKLSGPLIMGSMAHMLITAGDVYVASKYSTHSVAAIGVASGFLNPFFLFGIGTMFGLSPMLSIKRGQGVAKKNHLMSSTVYALVLGSALSVIALLAQYLVPLLEIKQELIPSITTYSKIVVWSFPFGIAFQALKEYLQGFEDVFMPNLIAVIAIFFNVGVNYLFVFGYADFAGMGEVGLAWATFATRVMLFATLFIYILKKEGVSLIDWELIAEIFKFSLPIGFMFFLEVLAFCSVSMLSGKFDVNAAAANNVAMILSSIAFMIPMGLSGAVAVKVGHAYGKQNKHEIHEYTKASVILIGIVVSITVSLFTFMPETMMGLYTNDKNVIDIGVSILGIVAIFQLVDSLQVTFTGVLRGMKYTNEVTWMILIGYWFFGIPIGYYLSFHSNIGVSGLWIGLAIALFLVSAALITFYWRKYKKLKFHNVM